MEYFDVMYRCFRLLQQSAVDRSRHQLYYRLRKIVHNIMTNNLWSAFDVRSII